MIRRTLRVANLIRNIVAEAIAGKLADPRIAPLTSITRVEVSPDFSSAHIHVSVMAEANKQKLTIQALQHAAGMLRSLVADAVTMRQAPYLTFHLDPSLQKSMQTLAAIDKAMAELAPAEAAAADDIDAESPMPGASRSAAEDD